MRASSACKSEEALLNPGVPSRRLLVCVLVDKELDLLTGIITAPLRARKRSPHSGIRKLHAVLQTGQNANNLTLASLPTCPGSLRGREATQVPAGVLDHHSQTNFQTSGYSTFGISLNIGIYAI